MAVLAMICYIMCYKLSTERIVRPVSVDKNSNIFSALKGLTRNRPFISQISASLILILAQLLSQSLNTYLYKDYFENTTALAFAGLITIINIVVIAPAVGPIIKRFGKKEAASAALLFSSVSYFLLYLIPTHNAYLFVGLNFIANLGFTFFNFTLWAFVTDIIDYQETITGEREDGTVYSFYTFARKIGQAAAGIFGGLALQIAGYVKAPQQTVEVANNIRNLATLIPAIAYFIVFLCLAFWYPMNKAKTEQLAKDLEDKHASK